VAGAKAPASRFPITVLAALLVLGACQGRADASLPVPNAALTPEQAAAAALPGGKFRDRVLPQRPRNRARAAAAVNPRDPSGRIRGGLYTGRAGNSTATLRVYVSNRFATWDRSVNQLWANRFVAMLKGKEISTLRVYITPLVEIRSPSVCGPWADSCYDPNDGTIYLTGQRPEDGADINQIAMHEYAHHIATNRLNTPWDGSMWGPKHWATAQRVCWYTAERQMWPTDPMNHYEDHPGEIWAESYRLVTSAHQGLPPDPWEILNPRWDPTGKSDLLSAIRRDVLQPWTGPRTTSASGTLSSAGPQSVTRQVSLPLDGQLSATLKVKGSLKTRVEVTNSNGTRIGSSSTRSAAVTACDLRTANVVVRRTGGSGSWSLKIVSP